MNQRRISFLYEDSKSLAQAGLLTEIKDVDNLKILIEEVRLDQDMKAQVLCMSFYVNLSIGCRTIKGVQHQWFDITKNAHSYPM